MDYAVVKDEPVPDWFDAIRQRFEFPEETEDKDQNDHTNVAYDADELNDELESDDSDKEQDTTGPSRKQQRLMSIPTLAYLKTVCSRPEVVDVWDCTAQDPLFLVYLKSYRNTVPVPIHWCNKRNYMQGKRGIDKSPYCLPDFIEATKISQIRSALQEKERLKSLKQKQREKVRPKLHRMDIDYQVLHDAFFKYATKPRLTVFGDVYYEGKEAEMKLRRYKPGVIDERLREALGMMENFPPPWLFNMQRYGPPPSFPFVKIPGLNAPIPAGAEYGYLPGQWGRPPVDQFGRPLYGDFTLESRERAEEVHGPLWAEFGEDERDAEEDDEYDETMTDGAQTPALSTGMETPSMLEGVSSVASSGLLPGGLSSVYSGSQTPSSIDITQRGIDSSTPKAYQVLHPQRAPAQPGARFQSTSIYKIPGVQHTNNIGGATTPIGGAATPIGGAVSVGGTAVTPFAGNTGLAGGLVTPYAPGMGGLITPSIQMSGFGGLKTPIVGVGTTPITHEDDFAADAVRKQLKKFEETAIKATKAAGQIPPDEVQKRKVSGPAASKKKKKEFKF